MYEYICTKHNDEKRPRTTSWRGRISGVGFAAKLERSNSIDRAWASKNIGISRHKSGGATLISEMPDTFQI
jgi:hypothetical protein